MRDHLDSYAVSWPFATLLPLFSSLIVVLALPAAEGGPTQLRVSESRRFLVTADGRPFFWLGDTAWGLFHRLDRSEAEAYLEDRAAKGFNVIQAVALAELDGLTVPNRQGHLPLEDKDPARPAVEPGPGHVSDYIHDEPWLDFTSAQSSHGDLVESWRFIEEHWNRQPVKPVIDLESSYPNALIYTPTGRPFRVRLGKLPGKEVKAWWFGPRNGKTTAAGQFATEGERDFTPPGEPGVGNDWVLALETVWRWREQVQENFATRMDWCVASHPKQPSTRP